MDSNRFYLAGEIDLATAPALEGALRNAAERHPTEELAVNCVDLTFIDTAGICALLTVNNELGEQGRRLRLVNPSRTLTRVLEILEVTWFLEPIDIEATGERLAAL